MDLTKPQVIFKDISISLEVLLIHDFLFNDKFGWGKYITDSHPNIKKIYQLQNRAARIKFLHEFISEFKNENKSIFKNNKEEYKKEWQKVETAFFKTLSEIMQISWPKNKKNITAMISMNPICPRFLDSWSFSVFYNYKKISSAIEVIMHECTHFLYFEKWKKIFPKMTHNKFESPHIEWVLSEIIAPIILNDKRIQKLLKQKASFYSEHEKIKIGDITAPRFFSNLYNKIVIKEKSFEEFLNEAYRIIKENQKLFIN